MTTIHWDLLPLHKTGANDIEKQHMEIKDKIIQTLRDISDRCNQIQAEWHIIGSSALILSNIPIGDTYDIDILTTERGSDEFQTLLQAYIEPSPLTKENDLFRSNFARFQFPLMDIEVIGDLQINKNGTWQDVRVNDYQVITFDNLSLKIPTLQEQQRILTLFGRDKDLKRLDLLNRFV